MATLITNFVQVHPIRLVGGEVEHLLLHRASNESIYPSIWQVITGRGEPGESTLQTAMRETSEEIGILPQAWYVSTHICSFYFPFQDAVVLTPAITCLLSPTSQVLLSEEHDRYLWKTAASAVEMLEFQTHREGVPIAEEWGRSLLKQP